MAQAGAPTPSPDAARLAAALGLDEERVARALASARAEPGELLEAVREGASDERLAAIARALRVDKARLTSALLDSADRAAGAAEGLVAAVRGTAEEALSVALEIVGESIPKLVNQALAVFAALGLAFVALGLLALINVDLFVRLLAVIAGLALIAAGVLLFALAWKVHEATATLRTLARVARRMRARRQEREREAVVVEAEPKA